MTVARQGELAGHMRSVRLTKGARKPLAYRSTSWARLASHIHTRTRPRSRWRSEGAEGGRVNGNLSPSRAIVLGVDRLLIALLAGIFGVVIGLSAPSVIGQVSEPDPTPRPTAAPLVLTRPPTPVPPPPTLSVPPTPVPPPIPPTPAVRVWTIPLAGGGEMKVVASDRAAAINNVKSSGAVPAD